MDDAKTAEKAWQAWNNLSHADRRFPGPLRLYNHHHGMHPADRVEDECIYLATDAEVLAYAATLDGAESLWWCEEHEASGSKLLCLRSALSGVTGGCRMMLWHRFKMPGEGESDEG